MDGMRRLMITTDDSNQSFATTLKVGSNDDYENLKHQISEQTGRNFPTDSFLAIGKDVIDSFESLESILEKRTQQHLEITLRDLKYTLLVNLNNGKNEYKPELTFTIPKRYVTKESKMTKWFDKIMNQIGNRLQVKNGQWQEKYELVEITKNKRVTDVNSFINILINHAIGNNSNDKQITFSIQSKSRDDDLKENKENKEKEENMFIFEQGSKVMKWTLDESQKSYVKQYNSLRKLIEKEFDVTLKTTQVFYDEIQSGIDISDEIDGNTLNRSKLGKYWSLLEKNVSKNKMYFSIGPIATKTKTTTVVSKYNYKKFLLFECNDERLEWVPSREDIENSDSWNNEYSRMEKEIIEYFGINKNDIKFSNINIEDGSDLYGEWDELINDDASFRKIIIESTTKTNDNVNTNNNPSTVSVSVSASRGHFTKNTKYSSDENEDNDDMYGDLHEGHDYNITLSPQFEILVDNHTIYFSMSYDRNNVFNRLCYEICGKLNDDRWQESYRLIDAKSGKHVDGNEILDELLQSLKKKQNPPFILSLRFDMLHQNKDKSQNDHTHQKFGNDWINYIQTQWGELNWILTKEKDNNFIDAESVFDILLYNIDERENMIETVKMAAKMKRIDNKTASSLQRKFEINTSVKNSFEILFDILLKRLVNEAWSSTSSVCRGVTRAKERVVSKQDWSLSSRLLKKALKEIRPFDFGKMFKLYDMTEQVSNEVEDEDIALLLGHTGAGKSTTIHFLAGSTMDYDKNTGHIYPSRIPTGIPQLHKIETEFKMAESVTRYISGVPLSLKDAKVFVKDKNKIVLCDSPGFDDSAGCEVDVANGLGIVNAVSKAKSVKLLLAIGYGDIETRMKGFKNVATNLASIVPNYKDFLDDGAIHIFFTKLKDEHRNKKVVIGWAEQAMQDMTDMDETNGAAFDLLEHVSNQDSIITLHPVRDDRKKVLRHFFNRKDEWIDDPSEEFQPFVSKSSLDCILQQIARDKDSIDHACSQQPFAYGIIGKKLSHLIRLHELLPDIPSVDNGLRQSIEIVRKEWNKSCQTQMHNLVLSIKDRSVYEFDITLSNYRRIVSESKEFNSMASKMKGIEILDLISSDQLYQSLNKQFDILLGECHLNKRSKIYFDKCEICLKYFNNLFEPLYKKKVTHLATALKENKKETKEMIDNNSFNQVYSNLASLNAATELELPIKFVAEMDIAGTVTQLVEYLMQYLEKHLNTLKTTFGIIEELNKGSLISETSLKAASESFNVLEEASHEFAAPFRSVRKSTSSREIFETVNEIYRNGCGIIVDYCVRMAQKINEQHLVYSTNMRVSRRSSLMVSSISSEENDSGNSRTWLMGKQNSLYGMKAFVQQVAVVRKMNLKIKNETAQAYYQMIERLIGYLQRVEYLFERTIDLIENDPLGDHYGSLVNYVTILQSSNWVFELKNDSDIKLSALTISTTNEYVKRVERKLEEYMENMMEDTSRLLVTLDEPKSADSVKMLVDRLNNIKTLHALFPDFKETSDHIMGILEKDIHQILQEIRKDFNLKSHNDFQIQHQTKLLDHYRGVLEKRLHLLTIKLDHNESETIDEKDEEEKIESKLTMDSDLDDDFDQNDDALAIVPGASPVASPGGSIDPGTCSSVPAIATISVPTTVAARVPSKTILSVIEPLTRVMSPGEAIKYYQSERDELQKQFEYESQQKQDEKKASQQQLTMLKELELKINCNNKTHQNTNNIKRGYKTKQIFGKTYDYNYSTSYGTNYNSSHSRMSNSKTYTYKSKSGHQPSKWQMKLLNKHNFNSWTEFQKAIDNRQKEIEHIDKTLLEYESEYDDRYRQLQMIITTLRGFEQIERELKANGFLNHQIQQWRQNISSLKNEISARQASLNAFPKAGAMKHSSSYTFLSSLNLIKTDKALTFIEKCCNIPFKRSIKSNKYGKDGKDGKDDSKMSEDENLLVAINKTRSDLQKYLSEYNKSCQFVMDQAFEYLVNIRSSDGNSLEISEYGCTLEHHIVEFRSIRDKYPIVMKYMTDEDDILKPWIQKIQRKYRDFNGDMEYLAANKDATLQIGVHHAKALSKLDLVLKSETQSESFSFNALYLEYMKRIGGNEQDMKELCQAIVDEQKLNFVAAGNAMNSLEKKVKVAHKLQDSSAIEGTYNRARMLLGRAMVHMYENTKVKMIQLPSDVSGEQISQIQDPFKLIKEANLYCKKFLFENDKKICQDAEEAANDHLRKWVRNILHSIKVGIDTKQFESVERKLIAIKDILEILGALVDTDGKLKQQVQDCEEKLKKQLKKILKEYKKIHPNDSNFNPYNGQPPKELYKQLHKVMNSRAIYSETWQKIEGDIVSKFRQLLEKARRLNGHNAKRIIRLCQGILKTLPQETGDVLTHELTQCEADVNEQSEHDRKNLQQLLETNNIKELQKKYNEKLHNGHMYGDTDSTTVENIKEHVVDRARTIQRNIELNMTNLDGPKVFDSFVELDKIVSEFNGAEAIRRRDSTHTINVTLLPHVARCSYSSDSSDGTGSGVSESHGSIRSKTKLRHDRKRGKTGFYPSMEKNSIFELDNILAETRKTIESHYTRVIDDVEMSIINNQDSLEIVDNKIEYIVSICVRNGSRSNAIFSGQFDIKNQTFAIQMTSYFENLNNGFVSGIEENNVLKLQEFFDCMIVYDNDKSAVLLEKLKHLDEVNLDDLKSYKHRVHQCIDYLDSVRKKIEPKGINNEETKANDSERNHYYAFLKKKMNFLFDIGKLEYHLKINTKEKFFEPCVLSIQRDIKLFTNDIQDAVEKTRVEADNDTFWQRISVGYKNLVAFENLELIDCKINPSSKNAKHEYNKNVKNIRDTRQDMQALISGRLSVIVEETYTNRHEIDKLAKHLIIHSIACTSLPSFRKIMESSMTHTIDRLQSEKPQLIAHLAVRLDQINPTWADSVKKSHKAFEGANTFKFNKSTAEQGIDYVLNHMECEELDKKESEISNGGINKKAIKKRFEKFDKLYWKYVKLNLNQNINVKPLTTETHSLAQNLLKKHCKEGKLIWNKRVKDGVIEIMACVFAIWTLIHSESYFTATDAKDKDAYLKQPRTAQVVSIIRLLSIDDSGDKMVRNLVQIGTGEGKSLTLAVTSCILALLHFDVSCACYSARLSRRDGKEFQDLFCVLNISKRIHYGTFNQLCEMVINEGGNVREMVENTILPKYFGYGGVRSPRKLFKYGDRARKGTVHRRERLNSRILLIDEVDVFFNPDFYGNVYNPAAKLKHTCIKPLTDYIWQHHQLSLGTLESGLIPAAVVHDHDDDAKSNIAQLTLAKIQKTQEYKECANVFSGNKDRSRGDGINTDWLPLLDEAIKAMLSNVKTFKTTEYVVFDDKIGYKEGDGVSTNASLGYNTLFTYYYEHSKGNITEKSLKNEICIYLKCGTFSYAEIPKRFGTILGVTGTLKTLSKPAKCIIRDTYGVIRNTYMPSLFGINKYRFNEAKDVNIYNIENYHEGLKEEIRKQISIDGKAQERCVLVFFQDGKKLDTFLKYPGFSLYRHSNKVLKLTETLTSDERDRVIKLATTSGRITLCTKSFGRGTDFQVNDTIVKNNDGPHVIQTFISEEQSEEVQIKGRTARQGGDGSFSMVIRENELDKYGVTKTQFEKAKKNDALYRLLNGKRNRFFEAQYKEDTAYVTKARASHREAEKLVNALKSSNTNRVKEILWKQNRGPSEYDLVTKIAILMDATGSMWNLIAKAKNTVEEMFSRISNILESKKIDSKCFQIQFVAYRNYDAPPDELLRYSGWYSDGGKLRQFLSKIKANYGWGTNEAVEVALQHVRLMIEECGDDVTEIILMGDAGCNTKDEVITKRDKRKDEWNKSNIFKNATFFMNEIEYFKSVSIKIHTCALDKYAEKDFNMIANETGGVYQKLNIDNTQESGEKLTNLVAQYVLNARGGKELVDAYKQKFIHVKH